MFLRFIWTPEIEAHLAEHGVTVDDYQYAFENACEEAESHSTGLPAFFGPARDCRMLIGVFLQLDDIDAVPVTAYFVDDDQ